MYNKVLKIFAAGTVLLSCASLSVKGQTAYLVSDAHLDTQWNWDVQKTISEYVPKTLYRNLLLLEKYPDYVFNFEGGIKYAWMKEYYPEAYQQIKQYVAQDRWHICGSTWDATDPNMPSSESLIRNILYGQHFYEQEFGVLSTDIFLPDCFGFGWHLPTVATHCGLIGFSTQKLQWRRLPFYGNKKVPFEIGLWQGVDGSRIMAAPDGHGYGTRWKMSDLSSNETLIDWSKQDPLGIVYHYYGTGDTGGSPSIESVAAVQYTLENGKGPLKVISATSDQLFKDFLPFENHPELPVYDGELLMDLHATGCYTSQAAMKLFNRRNEQLADAAERSSVIADWMGKTAYPRQTLSEAWKRVIWHQFHDDLTGTSIPRAYEFSWNDELISLGQFADVLTTSVGAASSELDTRVKGTPVVVYNPSGFERTDIIELDESLFGGAAAVYGPDGKAVTSQVVDGKLVFAASVPSLGMAVYDVRKGSARKGSAFVTAKGNTIENSVYKVTLDSNGDIASIVDKRCSRELVADGKPIRLALFTDNKSFSWPAWEILKTTVDQEPVSITGDVKISTASSGSVKGALKVTRTDGNSTFCQYVTLYEGADADRIDILTEIEWATLNSLLKVEFPFSFANPEATYDLGVGHVRRDNNVPNKYEVIAHQWTDLSSPDGSYGVSILNDCKYGWDKPTDNTVRLTLLHTPETSNGYRYQDHQDLGHHILTYSIVGHSGDLVAENISAKAEALNQPLKAFIAPRHNGSLGKTFSFLSCDNDAVALRACKIAEDSDEIVVRFYEKSGKGLQNATVSFAAPVVEAHELNGNEKVISDASCAGGKLSFDIKPFSIKTFSVKLSDSKSSAPGIVSAPVDLPFNFNAATYNGFQNEGNCDGLGNSYAAELIPSTLSYKGADFVFGDPALKNVVRCNGQEIALPEGNWNKVYLLAASTRKDVSAEFKAGESAQTLYVPYFGGFVGQWGHTGHTEAYVKDASIALVGTHKHSMHEPKNLPYDFTYMFCLALDVPQGAKTITLPVQKNVLVFAASAVSDGAFAVKPAEDLMNVDIPTLPVPEPEDAIIGMLLDCEVIGTSGEANRREKASMAVDDNTETKWCDNGPEQIKFIDFNLLRTSTIKGWYVLHAGMEAPEYITNSFALQIKLNENDEWKTVDEVKKNSELETNRKLAAPVEAQFVRLAVTDGDQEGGNVARIYEFSVY